MLVPSVCCTALGATLVPWVSLLQLQQPLGAWLSAGQHPEGRWKGL